MRKIFKFAFLLLVLWAVSRFCHVKTKGLRLSKFWGNTSPITHQFSPPLPETLRPIFKQKFSYLGRGLQSFSFVSEDQTTVLKIFNNHYQNRLFWLKSTPFKEKILYNQNKLKMAFESYELAYEKLREETGLLFFHPKACSDCPKVCLVDALGIEHCLDLSKTAFVLQKKGELVYPYLETCEGERALHALKSLLSLLKRKMDLGIGDKDPLIRTNFGFLSEGAMQIDIGPLYFNPELKDPKVQKEEIGKITLSLKHWMENKHPELLPYLYEALQNF